MDGPILIVDDEPKIHRLLSTYLRGKGFQTQEAQNGVEALHLIKTVPPALIILDITMPVMNGCDLLKFLKTHPTLCRTPVIMLTAKTEPDALGEGITLGADFYLPKPVKLENLLAFIELTLKTS